MDNIKEFSSKVVKTAATGFSTAQVVKNYIPATITKYSGDLLASISTPGLFGIGTLISLISDFAIKKLESVYKNHPNPFVARSMTQLFLNCVFVGPLVTLAAAVVVAGSSVAVFPALIAGSYIGAVVFVSKLITDLVMEILKKIGEQFKGKKGSALGEAIYGKSKKL